MTFLNFLRPFDDDEPPPYSALLQDAPVPYSALPQSTPVRSFKGGLEKQSKLEKEANYIKRDIPDCQLNALSGYDIVYIVDDSVLMGWVDPDTKAKRWPQAHAAIRTMAKVCEEWAANGQDLYFLNNPFPELGATASKIDERCSCIVPDGDTNMGKVLMNVARNYFKTYNDLTPPLNILAITDGAFTDDVSKVIRWICEQLDQVGATLNQIGIQFVQIGNETNAREELERLKNELVKEGVTRDIVDTVPWYPKKVRGRNFDGSYLLKVVCGAINHRLGEVDYSRRPFLERFWRKK